MKGLVFLKLGGSLITDKTRSRTLRGDVLRRLAGEIGAALKSEGDLRLLIGHGSGSFGHVAASAYGTRSGVISPDEWRGYAHTALVAGQLNRLVLDALWDAGVPVLPLQPSASARCIDGELVSLDLRPIRVALEHELVPVVYGDVALDDVRGGTIISTEEIFRWLAAPLAVERVILVGEVPGVLTGEFAAGSIEEGNREAPQVISRIVPEQFTSLARILGGSRGIDVTGGMLAKVREMLALVQETPSLTGVQLISGLTPGLVQRVLLDSEAQAGTRIQR